MPQPPAKDPIPLPGPALRSWVRQRLLAWFDAHRRDLPWRRDRDPYRIWVSEVMLQQTQVTTVVPYFNRFVEKWPTVTALAAADEQEVLRMWEGLGYYRRARDLHRAARELGSRHQGRVPNDPAVLGGLPGMGRYTVGAILSIAFDRRLPILEANSQRLLSRFFGRTDDPTRGPARRWLWQAAEALLPRGRVGSFNQALMEVGALVCTPTAPRCGDCPLARRCEAKRLGIQEKIPPKTKPVAITEVSEVAVVIRQGGRVLLVQRPGTGRWAGLWEFPHGPITAGERPADAAGRVARELAGLTVAVGKPLPTIRHGITRYRITLTCFEATVKRGAFRSSFYATGEWLEPGKLGEYPVSAPQRRLALAVAEGGEGNR